MNDRERLIELLDETFEKQYDRNLEIASRPTANYLISHGVTVQKHGRWVGLEYDGYADGCPVYDLWECSECGEEVCGEGVPEVYYYCPNCGAKMDGEANG